MKKGKLLLIGSTEGSVHIKNYYNLIKDYFSEILIVSNVPVDFCANKTIGFSLKKPLVALKNIKKLEKIITEFSPDIIHAHQASAFAFIANKANKGRFPMVLTAWGSDIFVLPNLNFLMRQLVKYNLRKADYITGCSCEMLEEMGKLVKLKNKPIKAIFGIDEEYISESVTKEKIIYSNRLHEKIYNVDKIIMGFSEFILDHPEWKLLIAAKGSKSDELKKIAKNNLPDHSYEFVGFIDKVSNINNYKKASMYIGIPNTDCSSISMFEAMAFGCIPLVSNIQSNKEVIMHNVNGRLIELDNISREMKEALKMDVKKVNALNNKIVLEIATKKVNKEKFISIYDSLS